MGYALHGNDISTDTDPFEARLGWAVAMDKGDFRGREALAARKEAGPKRLLVGLLSGDRLIPRHGMAVLDGDRPVGEVTSGTFSPDPAPGHRPGLRAARRRRQGHRAPVDVRGSAARSPVTRPRSSRPRPSRRGDRGGPRSWSSC
jgi:aminomethyltransferase